MVPLTVRSWRGTYEVRRIGGEWVCSCDGPGCPHPAMVEEYLGDLHQDAVHHVGGNGGHGEPTSGASIPENSAATIEQYNSWTDDAHRRRLQGWGDQP